MAAITRRTIFYEIGSDGEYRWHDWAMVNTSLGNMLEPRTTINPHINLGNSGTVRDFSDDMLRVDNIVNMSLDRVAAIMSDTPLVGGHLLNRTGR